VGLVDGDVAQGAGHGHVEFDGLPVFEPYAVYAAADVAEVLHCPIGGKDVVFAQGLGHAQGVVGKAFAAEYFGNGRGRGVRGGFYDEVEFDAAPFQVEGFGEGRAAGVDVEI